MKRRSAAAVFAGLIASGAAALPATAADVAGRGLIVKSGPGYVLVVKNTGTQTLRCMRWFAPAGTTVTSATGAGTTSSFGGGFGAQSLTIAANGATRFTFRTSRPLTAGADGSLHLSADCVKDIVAALSGPAAPPPKPKPKPKPHPKTTTAETTTAETTTVETTTAETTTGETTTAETTTVETTTEGGGGGGFPGWLIVVIVIGGIGLVIAIWVIFGGDDDGDGPVSGESDPGPEIIPPTIDLVPDIDFSDRPVIDDTPPAWTPPEPDPRPEDQDPGQEEQDQPDQHDNEWGGPADGPGENE